MMFFKKKHLTTYTLNIIVNFHKISCVNVQTTTVWMTPIDFVHSEIMIFLDFAFHKALSNILKLISVDYMVYSSNQWEIWLLQWKDQHLQTDATCPELKDFRYIHIWSELDILFQKNSYKSQSIRKLEDRLLDVNFANVVHHSDIQQQLLVFDDALVSNKWPFLDFLWQIAQRLFQ